MHVCGVLGYLCICGPIVILLSQDLFVWKYFVAKIFCVYECYLWPVEYFILLQFDALVVAVFGIHVAPDREQSEEEKEQLFSKAHSVCRKFIYLTTDTHAHSHIHICEYIYIHRHTHTCT